jgi:hypothetical protein
MTLTYTTRHSRVRSAAMVLSLGEATAQEKRIRLLQARSATSQPPNHTRQGGLQDTS